MTTTRHGDRPGHDHRTLNHAALAYGRSSQPTGGPANSHAQRVIRPGKPATSAPPEEARFAAWKSALGASKPIRHKPVEAHMLFGSFADQATVNLCRDTHHEPA